MDDSPPILAIVALATLPALVAIAVMVLVLFAFRAHAQTWTLEPVPGTGVATAPGQPPQLVQRFDNGWAIGAAGQIPTLVQPFAGGWIVIPPMIPQPVAPVIFPSIGGY